MKYLKYIILIVVLIIIEIIIILKKMLGEHMYEPTDGPVENPQPTIELNKIVSDVSFRDYYYDVESIIEKYYSYLTDLNKIITDYMVSNKDSYKNFAYNYIVRIRNL